MPEDILKKIVYLISFILIIIVHSLFQKQTVMEDFKFQKVKYIILCIIFKKNYNILFAIWQRGCYGSYPGAEKSQTFLQCFHLSVVLYELTDKNTRDLRLNPLNLIVVICVICVMPFLCSVQRRCVQTVRCTNSALYKDAAYKCSAQSGLLYVRCTNTQVGP